MTGSSWQCAGCGSHQKMRKIDKFRTLRVEIATVTGHPLLNEEYELCPNCQNRLVKLASMKNWASFLVEDDGGS